MKLALGTVQFGLDYGINSSEGKIEKSEVERIIDFARKVNINILDTAPSYGNSEKVLGDINTKDFQIITKTRHFNGIVIGSQEESLLKDDFKQSLKLLDRGSVYAVLVHNADDLLKPGADKIFRCLQEFRENGKLKKIGVSIYNSSQLSKILDTFDIDIVQLPINIFDQQLLINGWLDKLKNNNIEIHARSVFLQGLLLMKEDFLPSYFLPILDNLIAFHNLAKELSVTDLELALGYVMSINEVDKILVGVEKVSQLKDLIKVKNMQISPKEYLDFSINDSNFTNPSLWKI
jgi:aryl-alcohol dehydrogenase-like predicted oxidoreductase